VCHGGDAPDWLPSRFGEEEPAGIDRVEARESCRRGSSLPPRPSRGRDPDHSGSSCGRSQPAAGSVVITRSSRGLVAEVPSASDEPSGELVRSLPPEADVLHGEADQEPRQHCERHHKYERYCWPSNRRTRLSVAHSGYTRASTPSIQAARRAATRHLRGRGRRIWISAIPPSIHTRTIATAPTAPVKPYAPAGPGAEPDSQRQPDRQREHPLRAHRDVRRVPPGMHAAHRGGQHAVAAHREEDAGRRVVNCEEAGEEARGPRTARQRVRSHCAVCSCQREERIGVAQVAGRQRGRTV